MRRIFLRREHAPRGREISPHTAWPPAMLANARGSGTALEQAGDNACPVAWGLEYPAGKDAVSTSRPIPSACVSTNSNKGRVELLFMT